MSEFDKTYIDELMNEFFKRRLKTEKVRKDYKRELNRFSSFIDKDFSEATFDDCKAFIDDLIGEANKNKISMATVERIYSTLFSMFNFLEETLDGFCNHFKRIEKPYVSRNVKPEKIISWCELDKLISVFKNDIPRNYAIFMLIFTSGITLGELVDLKWNQIVQDSSGNTGIIFDEKNGKRYVKIHPDVWELLEVYRATLGPIGNDSHIFLNNRNAKISTRRVRGIFKEACEKAGLENNYSPRDLRHSVAALALKKGASASQVKEQLGWSDTRIAQWYLYTIQALDDNAIDYLNFKLK
ncbi:tyrosine-type recombinase/integrase [Wukongibacter baidiensis]